MLTTKAGKAILIEIDEIKWKLDGTGGLLLNMRLITRDPSVLEGVRHVEIVSEVSVARAADNASSPWKTSLSITERGAAPIRIVHIHFPNEDREELADDASDMERFERDQQLADEPEGTFVTIPCDLSKAVQVVVDEAGEWYAVLTVRASMGCDESCRVHGALCCAAREEALTAAVMELQGGLDV